jgi:drug/metabolite transporter (DMT)-like permease
MRRERVGAAAGLLSAVAFGASAPLAQRLVQHADPQLLAGLLYAGAAVCLWLIGGPARRNEAPLRRADLRRLGLVIGFGGVLGPVLLLAGLQHVSGTTGALTLNLEAPFTALLAVLWFGEYLGARGWMAGGLIVAGAALLAVAPGSMGGDALGVTLIGCACLCWALDNNVTQQLTVRDPISIVRTKASIAAAVNLGIALARQAGWPTARVVAATLVLGAVSYGASIVLDAYALRLIGAAREAALFATAPFVGVVLAVALGEPFTVVSGAALVLMAVGALGMLTDRHEHEHVHEALAHEHRHVHDEHHQHEHPPGVEPGEPHSHWHEHEPIVHAHPHASDVHHRHRHRHRPPQRG